ncbi:helix-turn-helix domain-containing protein [Pseudomonas putida]|uniref:helix-turn-helix domain-containing protein n=1 Tax=Pseudomonas putida TaxID=303 RepID=UPI0023631C0B|nr:helix-turn-helix domain-containing protein [Pseudomonas putida]MDD2067837.1 helix-turn-helix domain-containing protein [Pseudomonas putida]HDS1738278.1 helix-turn-helix domain-containing protein [Pseudomonas putida]
MQLRIAEELGAAVRQVRKQQAITQTDLADIVGKSHVLLTGIEIGKGMVAIARLLEAERALYADLC